MAGRIAMVSPTPYLRLPLSFDMSRLQQDLEAIENSPWIGHFNTSAYEKGWGCIPLRSVGGRLDHIMPLDGVSYADTPLLARCPYIREVLASFACEKTSVRFMALEAGGVIHEHRDAGASLDDGLTRLHIPVRTSPEVLFRVEGQEVHFSAGDTWYLNASCLHGVTNGSTRARVHLMLDCVTNPWLERLFMAAGGRLREPPAYGDPAIHDGNVMAVVDGLLAGGHARGAALAADLMATHARRQAPGSRH